MRIRGKHVGLVACLVLGGWWLGWAAADAPPRLYRDRVDPHWLADGNRFWYSVALPGGQQEFVLVDAEAGTRLPAFDPARLAASLSQTLGKPVDPHALPVRSLTFPPDAKTLIVHGPDGSWTLDLSSYALTPAPASDAGGEGLRPQRTPHPSRSGSVETTIRFRNQLTEEVNLFWLDETGERRPYGSLLPGKEYEQHTYAGHAWLAAAKNGAPIAVFDAEEQPGVAVIGGPGAPPPTPPAPERKDEAASARSRSPDQTKEVIVRGGNLFLREVGTGREQPLTTDARRGSSYARNAEGSEGVELEPSPRVAGKAAPEVYWSPDSRHFAALRFTSGSSRRVTLVQTSPPDQLQPKTVSIPYLKPGDDVPYVKPHLFDAIDGKEIPVSDALFSNPWAIDGLRWKPDGSEFTFQFNQRGHQVLRILGVNAGSGAVRPVVEEQNKTFVCYSSKFFAEYLDDTSEIIWMSERDGWNHLYLYDVKTGQVKNQITRGEWVVRGVDRVDREKRQIWFHAGGMNPGEDPYHVHYYRINLDGTGLTALTSGDGTHAIRFSPDRRFLIDTWSRVNLPPVNDLHRTGDGKLLCRLEEADSSERSARGWPTPEPFVAKGRDGATDIYGVIFRPRYFDPARRYPVLEDIYAGPQDSFVPKGFLARSHFQDLADRGFVIVQIDGMGTSNRSKAFHDVCWKNLADAGLPDRILWIKAAAAEYPSLDLTRVGIFGTSAGGQSALRALLDHGDFYRVAVADSGCHDNRMDKIWWNEQWMGWPVDDSYARSSNVVDAHKLRGKLLLMVGEMDRNVDPASTMQVVDALVKADKDFDLLAMPNAGHGVASTPYGRRRLMDFFTRHLLHDPAPKDP